MYDSCKGCYRSSDSDVKDFNSTVQDYLENKQDNFLPFISDISINILNDDSVTIEYMNTLYEYGYISTINQPTSDKSCLDYIFIK